MIKNYLKIAWRNLFKRKVFTAINVFGLAIGMGGSVLIYLFLSHHFSFDGFHAHSDRIYRIVTEEHRDLVDYEPAVPPAFAKTFREQYDYAEKVAKINTSYDQLIQIEAPSGTVQFKENVVFAEPDFFNIFTFPLVDYVGTRSLDEPFTAYISEGLSRKVFKEVNPLGKTFVLENEATVEIIGIVKDIPNTSFMQDELFVSMKTLKEFDGFAASESWGGITNSLQCFALLHPNQDIAGIESVLKELPKIHRPNSKNRHVYKLQPLADIHFNAAYGGTDPTLLWIFAIIGGFILIIACINFINISTAQAFYRSKEVGIRKVLGSAKGHLFWQFLSETFIISLFAVGIGLVLVALSLPSFNHLFEIDLSIDSLWSLEFFGFTLALLALVSLFSGSYPGILMARIVPVLALKGKLNPNDTGGKNLRKVLVVVQFAISIGLIATTLIISRQIDYAVNTDLGFNKNSVVMLPIPKDLNATQIRSLNERLSAIPGVQKVSACLSSPGGSENSWGTGVKYNNRPEYEEFNIQAKLGDAHFLNTFEIPLVAGRNIFEKDAMDEVVVNLKFAEKLGITDPEALLGKPFEANGGDIKATIVGVMENFHNHSFNQGISPVFVGYNPEWFSEIAVKLSLGNTKTILEQIGEQWSKTFPGFIYEYRFLDERVAAQYENESRYLSISKAFSALAVLIGCLGLYGLILFFVGQRKKEIGIRKVLGSDMTQIVALFATDFLRLVCVAGVIATPIAWYFMDKWLQGYAYRTQIQWWVFALAIGAIMLITLATIGYKTIKTAMENPVKSLRTE